MVNRVYNNGFVAWWAVPSRILLRARSRLAAALPACLALWLASPAGAQVLGSASGHNVFVFEEADLRFVLVRGTLAAGRSALLWRASVADDAAQVPPSGDAVVVAGPLDLLDCDIRHGNLRTGAMTRLVRTRLGDGVRLPGVPVDFEATRDQLTRASTHWATLRENGVRSFSSASLVYRGTDPALNVLRLRDEDVLGATSLVLEAPASSTLLVDYTGTAPWLRNFRVTVRGLDGSRVLHNFSAATMLGLEGVAIVGAIVAPGAKVTLTGGSAFEGPLIARSIGGPQTPTFLTGERFVRFAGELPSPPTTVVPPGSGCAQVDLGDGPARASALGLFAAALLLLAMRRSRRQGIAFAPSRAARLAGLLGGLLLLAVAPAAAQSLGPAAAFDAFVLRDATFRESSSEGALAVGGNALLFNYVVGSGPALPLDRARDDLVVGGVLHFVQGVVAKGRARSGGHAALFEVGASSETGAPPVVYADGNPVAFEAAQRYFEAASELWAALPVTGTTRIEDTLVYRDGQLSDVALTLTLRGTQDALNVFTVAAHELALASAIDLDVPAGSTALINVSGDYAELRGVGFLHSESLRPSRILFHFPEAQVLHLSGVVLRGSVVAPRAALRAFVGHLHGQLVVDQVLPGLRDETTVEMLPSLALHHAPFDGALPAPSASMLRRLARLRAALVPVSASP